MNRKILASAALMTFVAGTALAQQGVSNSTNGYTAAQRTAAEAAVSAAGYTPGAIASAQAGSVFIHGEKGGARFILTVTSDGKVYASAGSTAAMPVVAAPPGGGGRGAGGGGRGGRGGGGDEN